MLSIAWNQRVDACQNGGEDIRVKVIIFLREGLDHLRKTTTNQILEVLHHHGLVVKESVCKTGLLCSPNLIWKMFGAL